MMCFAGVFQGAKAFHSAREERSLSLNNNSHEVVTKQIRESLSNQAIKILIYKHRNEAITHFKSIGLTV